MNRLILLLLAAGGLVVFPLMDSAIKGTAVLLIAVCVCFALRGDSAATRHFVWVVAICLLITMPVLSLVLPEWQVLPSWLRTDEPTVAASSPTSFVPLESLSNRGEVAELPPAMPFPGSFIPEVGQSAGTTTTEPGLEPAQSLLLSSAIPQAATLSPILWTTWLGGIWFAGCILLGSRLLAAAVLLRLSARRSKVITPASAEFQRLQAVLILAMTTLGVTRRIQLLLDPKRSIPVVWGLWKTRLQLPAEAVHWSDEQLQSVLLHELAHVRRRDLFVLAITQIACAMHWFNPLVWCAAWRLHIERERACDDLVLASGVRASSYAEHLLNVATKLTSSKWTQACGLAMARNSSLHGRLTAVLSVKQDRRSVTTAVLTLALIVSSAIAIPLAMLRAADETASGESVVDNAVVKEPLKPWAYRDMDSSLLRRWQELEDDKNSIPENRVATLRSAIGRFIDGIDQSPFSLTQEQISELKTLQTQGAKNSQHSASETQKLIKAVFAIHGEPIQMAFNEAPWPGTSANTDDLERLPFGPAASNGLRVALVCQREDFIFGDSARLDLRLWNTGSETLVVGIGRNGPGLYPKLALQAIGRDGRRVETKFGPESKMLKDVKSTKSWQLRPGDIAEVFGYRLRVGSGTPRENEGWPQWYTVIDLPDVQNGEDIQLAASLPSLCPPPTQSSIDGMQTGSVTIHATAPQDVLVWSAGGAGRWPMANGVTLEVKQENFHAADIATSVVLTWPQDATGTTYGFTSGVASDAFANREPWHVAWEKDSTTFWSMTGQLGDRGPGPFKPLWVRCIDFSDKTNITTTAWYHQPEAMPEGIQLEFAKFFQPLPATPRRASEAEGSVQIEQAHDVRPIDELLHGVWKNEAGDVDVQLTFPERDTDGIQWIVDYGQGVPVVSATVARIRSPANNSIRLWIQPSQLGNLDEKDVVGTVRRGPDSTLLLDITGSPKHPDYKQVAGIVLTQASDVEKAVSRKLKVEIDFARIELAKAMVDLEQRRSANKEFQAFTPAEIDAIEQAVLQAKARLTALQEEPKSSATKSKAASNVDWTAVQPPDHLAQDWDSMPKIPTIAFCLDMWTIFREQHLDWSEPVNGLRAAVMIQGTRAKGTNGNERKILIVLQNVSDKPIRFCDTAIKETDIPAADTEGRTLYLQDNGEILMGRQRAKSTQADVVLQPRGIHTIDMFDKEEPNERGFKSGDMLAEGIVKVPTRSLFAVLNIVNAPEGAWTGKLATPATRGAFAALVQMPNDAKAQTLFRHCIDHARLNGEIPGGLISRLHDMVQEFISLNEGDQSGDSYAKKMQPLVARFEQKGDWKQADVVKLFDDIADVTTIPLDRTMGLIREATLQRGQQLSASLNDANWGEVLPGGLRMAWMLESQSDAYHLGTSLKSHVVIHNSGKKPVVFVTRSFHQPEHKAKTASGATVQIESTFWTTRGQPTPYRLHPGEFCEVYAPGIGIGRRNPDNDDWANIRSGSWMLANEDEDIIFQPGEILLTGDHNNKVDPDWWLKFITERIQRDAPLPADAKEREVILFRVISDLFGNSPTPDEAAAFYPDMSSRAVDNLATLLSKRSWHTSVAGPIKSGEIKFHVLPEDPAAATRPRIALNPGRYNLGEEIRFVVTRRPIGERITNEADLIWYPPGKDSVPTKVPLPDGYDTWAACWSPETTVLWVSQKGLLRSYDFTDSTAIKETHYEADHVANAPIPTDLRDALRVVLEKSDASQQLQKPIPKPPAAAQAPPETNAASKPTVDANSNAKSNGLKSNDARPEWQHFWNDTWSAVAAQTKDDVYFVLVYKGFISSGMSNSWSSTTGRWTYEGGVHLVDTEATKSAGRNVDKRVVSVKYNSDDPSTLFLDGKGFRLDVKPQDAAAPSGRIFVLSDEGEPERINQSLTLHHQDDFERIAAIVETLKNPSRPFEIITGTETCRVKWADLVVPDLGSGLAIQTDFVYQLPARLKLLVGKEVRIRGVMYPTFEETGLTEFFLDSQNRFMNFMSSPRVDQFLSIKLAEGTTADFIDGRPFDVEGRIEIAPNGDEATLTNIYVLKDARILRDATITVKSSNRDEAPKPTHKETTSLVKKWQRYARSDGRIPGALLGTVQGNLEMFTEQYPDNEATPELAALLLRFDVTHD